MKSEPKYSWNVCKQNLRVKQCDFADELGDFFEAIVSLWCCELRSVWTIVMAWSSLSFWITAKKKTQWPVIRIDTCEATDNFQDDLQLQKTSMQWLYPQVAYDTYQPSHSDVKLRPQCSKAASHCRPSCCRQFIDPQGNERLGWAVGIPGDKSRLRVRRLGHYTTQPTMQPLLMTAKIRWDIFRFSLLDTDEY